MAKDDTILTKATHDTKVFDLTNLNTIKDSSSILMGYSFIEPKADGKNLFMVKSRRKPEIVKLVIK